MPETWVQSLGWEDRLEEGMATHSSILQPTSVFLPGESPWTGMPGGLQSTGLGAGVVTKSQTQLSNYVEPPTMLPGALLGLGTAVNQEDTVSALRELMGACTSQHDQISCVYEPASGRQASLGRAPTGDLG